MIVFDVIKIGGKVYQQIYSNNKVYIFDHAYVDSRGNELLEGSVLLPVGKKHNYVESTVPLPDDITEKVLHFYEGINCMLERSLF